MVEDAVKNGKYGGFYATAEDDKATRAKKFLARNWIMILALIFALIAVLVYSSMSSGRAEALDRQQAEILALEKEKAAKASDVSASRASVLKVATDGVDIEARSGDDKIVHELMETATTWSGIEDYLAKRSTVISDYGIPEESQFMEVFMPGEMQGVARTAPSGETHYAFDSKVSSNFDSLDTYVVAVNGDVYSYFAVVGMRVDSTDGTASSLMHATMRYDVVDDRVVNLVAETVPGGVERSG